MSEFVERALDWNDTIERENDFVILPEGIYNFEVTSFERSRHNGSAKLPPCNKAIVSIRVSSPEGSTTIRHNLFLHTVTEGLLSAFFKGIGQKQTGEKLQMDWDKVVGSKGVCKVGVRTWTGNNGEERESNEITRFYDPDDAPTPQAEKKTFTKGTF